MRKFLMILSLALGFPALAAGEARQMTPRVINLAGNTYNASTAVAFSSAADLLVFNVRPNPGTAGYVGSCELRISTVAAPNTYTAGAGYFSVPASPTGFLNDRTIACKTGVPKIYYLNLSQSAAAYIEIDSYHILP